MSIGLICDRLQQTVSHKTDPDTRLMPRLHQRAPRVQGVQDAGHRETSPGCVTTWTGHMPGNAHRFRLCTRPADHPRKKTRSGVFASGTSASWDCRAASQVVERHSG